MDKTNGNGAVAEVRLDDVWDRLNSTCRSLWNEDSPSAVNLQAIVEEFKGEVHRVTQLVHAMRESLSEQKTKLQSEFQAVYSDKIRTYELQLANASSRIAALDETLLKEREKVESLLKDLLHKDEENAAFHEKFLRIESEHDEERTRKMEAFYLDLQKKGGEMEVSWAARRGDLENEFKQRTLDLQKKHDALFEEIKKRASTLEGEYSRRERELTESQETLTKQMSSWESNRTAQEQSLIKRDQELKLQGEALASEYRKKQKDLEDLKEKMQREIGQLVQFYQSKTRSESGAGKGL